MRPLAMFAIALFLTAVAQAGTATASSGRAHARTPIIDLSGVGQFEVPAAEGDDSGLRLDRSVEPSRAPQESLVPSIHVGPFHATVGGVGRGRTHLSTYQIDSRDFWNSGVSGSIDGTGARLMFSLPTF